MPILRKEDTEIIMSSTLMIKFKQKEIPEIEKWLKNHCGDQYPELPIKRLEYEKEIERGIFFEIYPKKGIVHLDVAIWDDSGKCFATQIAREMFRAFNAIKAGWDSVGYYDDFLSESSDGMCLSWDIMILEEERKKFLKNRRLIKRLSETIEKKKETYEFYKKEAKKLFGEGE